MDGFAIAASLTEVCEAAEGAFIRGIYQPKRTEFVFHLFAGGDHRLLISIDAALIQLTNRDFANPLIPSPFTMLLRKTLRNGRVTAIKQQGWERVVQITVEQRRAAGTQSYSLIAELLGSRGNLVLVEEASVVAALRSDPRASPGSTYKTLPRQGKHDPCDLTADEIVPILAEEAPDRALVRLVDGMGRPTAHAVLTHAAADRDADSTAEAVRRAVARVVDHTARPSPQLDEATGWPAFFPLSPPGRQFARFSEALDEAAARLLPDEARAHRDALATRLQRAVRKHARTAERLQRWLARADAAPEMQHHADLLLTHRAEVPRGAETVTLIDPATEARVRIGLDPRHDAIANAQRFYERAKRLRRGHPIVRDRLSHIERDVALLREAECVVRAGGIPSEEAIDLLPPLQTPRRPLRPTAPRAFTIGGYTVLVGKDATQNDTLLCEARPHDLWLHARGVPGSHVFVRRPRGRDVPGNILRRAARLAIRYSKARGERRAEVTLAEVRHVRKPRGAAPGLVFVTQGDTLIVTPEGEGADES